MKILLKNGTIVQPDKVFKGDLCIEDGVICAIDTTIKDTVDEVIDVTERIILAGGIDAHTHFDLDTGTTKTADDFYTGTKAALVGGTTTIIDFATQSKGHSLKEAFKEWQEKAAKGTFCDYGFHMAITDWNAKIKDEMKDMVASGISSFKMYMAYKGLLQVDDGAIYEALQESEKIGALIGFHCENGDLIASLVEQHLAKGHTHPYYHKETRPEEVEIEAIHRLATISKLTGAPAWVVHLSTAKGLEVITQANKEGARLVTETCPQYLVLDESKYGTPEDGSFEGAKYVMSPPLRHKSNQHKLWEGLKNGTIACVSTDHCSFNYNGQKTLGKDNFSKIPNGSMGVEHRLRLMYTYGVCQGKLSLMELTKALSYHPAQVFGLDKKGSLEVGKDADLIVLNPRVTEVISHTTQLQNADYTTYEGMETKGRIETVFLRGKKVVHEGALVETQPLGIYQHRKTSK